MAFADAIVAIAITLLVLPLVDIPDEVTTTSLTEVWADHSADFLMFALSFVIIARVWISHHNFGERLAHGDRFILITTLMWLLTVVFLPFPTELLGELGTSPPIAGVYIATLWANITLLAIEGRYLSRRPAMWREGWTQRQMQVWVLGWWVNPVLTAAALIVCLFVPGVGIWSLLLLFLDAPVSHLVLRRTGLPPEEDAPASESVPDQVD